ncbi:MAG: sugar transferase [Candidatus Spechtbacteria bacterium]|nr:sugar transferase [Candidatus Spechtbacteria bacterium]
MKKVDLLFAFLLLPVDFLMLEAAGIAAYFLRVSPWVSAFRPVLFYQNLPFPYYAFLVAVLAAIFMALFAFAGLYAVDRRRTVLGEILGIILAVSGGMMLLIIAMFFQREWFDSRFILLAGWGLSIGFAALGRIILRLFRRVVIERMHNGKEATVLIGSDEHTQRIKEAIESGRGLRLVGVYSHFDSVSLENILLVDSIDHIIFSDSSAPRGQIMDIADFCQEHNIRFSFVPDLFGALSAQMQMEAFGGIPLLELKRTPLDGWGKITKRALDVVGAVCGLIILSPIFLICALAIKWESKGPIFVRLKRVSQGREFYLFKFRSMIENAEALKAQFAAFNERNDGPLFKLHNDPRVTRVGRYLRKGRLDEIPQLFNVLSGEMSLTGPRPHEPAEVAQYQRHHKKVFAVKAGISGLAQISGASDLPFEEEVKLDTYYVENWSLKQDIVILFRTLLMLLFDRSGY